MNEIRARVDAVVEDPATAEALKPWYRQLCKRPCFHDEYLQAYNEAGTHLVDTDGKVVSHALEIGATEVEATEEAEVSWVAQFDATTMGFLGNPDCTPGYYNNEGRAPGRRERLNASGYPQGPVAYFEYIDRWRSSGDFEGLLFRAGGDRCRG